MFGGKVLITCEHKRQRERRVRGRHKRGRGMGQQERKIARELHNAALHNLYSNIVVKESSAETWPSCEGITQTFLNIRH